MKKISTNATMLKQLHKLMDKSEKNQSLNRYP